MANLVQDGLRYNTKKAYTSAQKFYARFCHQFSLPLLPASQDQLLRFIAYAKQQGLSPATIHVYILGMVSLHHLNGFAPPATNSYRVKLAIRAINSQPSTSASRQPITYDLLHAMVQYLQKLNLCFPWISMVTLGFFGALRGAEYTATQASGTISAPLIHQVSFHRASGAWAMNYTIPVTKTTSSPVAVAIGCSGTSVCAVCSMLSYLNHRQLNSTLHPSSYLFTHGNGRPITKCQLNQVIKRVVSMLGLSASNFTTHSLRSGAASTASAAGFNEHEIQQLGHWTSQAYRTYIKNDYQHRYDFASRLASYHQ